ncbi:sodium-coupled monocarboxylate transporter 1-like [Culex pipiens pallens]|uniref:sodium-coupled monocarboxylate transporter 1-like n=1 Tax=Culex pipiens pallens TaxID=42434 RepID=UPI001953047A|nr:sodium-coupled monocarboxylate transporter 1-like [Culex pipiens pallens]
MSDDSQQNQPRMTTDAPPGLSVQDVSLSLQRFGLADYLVFSTMLLVCIGIGVYFGWKDHQKQKHKAASSVRRGSEALDYLVGNRRMKIFPVAMSLVASWISGIALMGAATETYLYGIHFGFIFTGIILMAFSMNFIFLPVFHSLQITSVYEYLEIRFDTRIRLLGSVLFTLATLSHLPIVVFVPALAFNQVSGINIHFITTIVCTVCIFYTSIGGIKAVVWTDVIQTVVMVGALILIVIKGTADIGGLSVLIERNVASGRIEPPNFSLDPTERTTIWAIFFGGGSFWVAKNAIHQMMIQRYLSLPTFRDAQKSLVVFTIGITFLMSICFYNGLLIYATFHDCDPLTTKLARAKDQLLPILVMKVFGDYPGLAGLFISGIFSASLSSLSTGLNSLAAIVLEDFVKPFTKNPLTERQTRYLMRGTVLVFGVIAVVLVLVVEKLGTVLQLSMSLVPISLGPLLGMFLMGMLLPWIDAKCAFAGACTGLTTMAYVVIRAQIAIASKEIVHPTKPVSTVGCTYHFDNVTAVYQDPMIHEEFDKSIHHVSFLFYTLIGVCSTAIPGLLYACCFGKQEVSQLNPLVVAPFLRSHFFPKKTADQNNLVHLYEKAETKL